MQFLWGDCLRQVVNVKTFLILINISLNTASSQSNNLNREMACEAAICPAGLRNMKLRDHESLFGGSELNTWEIRVVHHTDAKILQIQQCLEVIQLFDL